MPVISYLVPTGPRLRSELQPERKEVGSLSLIALKCTLDCLVTLPVGVDQRRAAISQPLSVVSGEVCSPQRRRLPLWIPFLFESSLGDRSDVTSRDNSDDDGALRA